MAIVRLFRSEVLADAETLIECTLASLSTIEHLGPVAPPEWEPEDTRSLLAPYF